MSDWEHIGEVGVDSGQLMVTDPCYVDGEWLPMDESVPPGDGFSEDRIGEYSYNGACSTTLYTEESAGQLYYKRGHSGAGVVISAGYGDGVYEVLVKRNDEGRIAELRVVMIEED